MKHIIYPTIILLIAATSAAQTGTSTGTGTTTTTTTTGTTTQNVPTSPDTMNTGTPGSAAGTTVNGATTNGGTMDDGRYSNGSNGTAIDNNNAGRTTTGTGGTASPGTGSTYNRGTAGAMNGTNTNTISGDNSTTTGTTGTGTGTGGNVASGGITDNQIAGILMTINDGEITAAKMALRRAKNKDVKEFARKMIDEHKDNMKDTKHVLKSYDMRTARSEMGTTLSKDAKEANSKLLGATKDNFDKMYIEEQITMHEQALATLNETLLPNASDATLKTHLEKTKTAVNEHLTEARALQTKLQ